MDRSDQLNCSERLYCLNHRDILDRGRTEFGPRNHTKNIDYVQSAADTQIVGRAVAYMFNELKKAGWSDSQFECVGHSLGGQACGYAGSYAKSAFRINVGK